MKKKIIISFLAICLCVISLFGLVGCKTPLNMPNSLSVTSNGGAVVRVGDYIYFTNGFVKTADLKYGDNRKNITQGAIYRVKVEINKALEYDDKGNMKGAEKIADNIGGFSSLNLFVYDEYLYYSTPLSTPDKQGNGQFGRTVIKQIKLNGESDRDIYTTNSSSPITWAVYKLGGQVVVGVLDGENLVSINVTTNKSNTLAQKVSSVVFPKVQEYNPASSTSNLTAGEQAVYYTRTDDAINGNAIYKANLKTLEGNDNPQINANNGSEYKVVDYKTDGLLGKLYYTVTEQGSTNYFGTTVNENGDVLSSQTSETTQYTTLAYEQVDFILNPRDEAIAIYKNSQDKKEVLLVNYIQTTKISDSEISILAIRDNFIYGYNSNNQLVKIGLDAEHKTTVIANFENEKDENDKEIEDGKDAFYSAGIDTDKLNKNLFVDFDGDYMYFFRNYKNNDGKESIYLARVNVNSSEEQASKVETVGQMEESHKYVISETASEK